MIHLDVTYPASNTRYTIRGKKIHLTSSNIPRFCGGRILHSFTGFHNSKISKKDLDGWAKSVVKKLKEARVGVAIAFFRRSWVYVNGRAVHVFEHENLMKSLLKNGFKLVGEYNNPNTGNRIKEIRLQIPRNS